jgi:methyl-accepting chemotaxis protein
MELILLNNFSLKTGADSVLRALHKSLAIIEFDCQGNILDANENFCSAVGYERSEIVGQHHSIFVDPVEATQPAYEEFWASLAAGNFDSGEYKRFGKGGNEIWIQATYNPVLNRSGKPVKVVKFASDITAAKMKSAEDDGKINAISRAQAVIEFEVDGTIITANENFCGAVGYDLSEIQGRHHQIFVEKTYGESAEYREFWKKLGDGEFIADEFQRFGKDGSEIWIQASYNPIFDAGGKVVKVVKFATDITGRVHAVTTIGNSLRQLSDGNLDQSIDDKFIPELDGLRLDFNQTLQNLNDTLSRIGHNAQAIDGGSQEIRSASDELSKRTEQQAAAVEETAAALEEITATVSSTAQLAGEAGDLVKTTKSEAERSGEVVTKAVSAMSDIRESSDQIADIIGVIDDIAFQTNLLALNAGVEAARAGEAGKGFAVVAQEVRELAQRSATAAKEIKELITRSGGQVQSGVNLVAETGEALKSIVKFVTEVNEHVHKIDDAAQEQSSGLKEINRAVNSIDEGTQQNAAMAEEVTASGHTLSQEVQELNAMLREFKLSREGSTMAQHYKAA